MFATIPGVRAGGLPREPDVPRPLAGPQRAPAEAYISSRGRVPQAGMDKRPALHGGTCARRHPSGHRQNDSRWTQQRRCSRAWEDIPFVGAVVGTADHGHFPAGVAGWPWPNGGARPYFTKVRRAAPVMIFQSRFGGRNVILAGPPGGRDLLKPGYLSDLQAANWPSQMGCLRGESTAGSHSLSG